MMIQFNFFAPLVIAFVNGVALPLFAAEQMSSPDILVLGDSQITFGAGPAYLKFFKNLKKQCAPDVQQSLDLTKLKAGSVAVIGVRSAELGSWVAKSDITKNPVCRIDPKWNVNAGVYGAINNSGEEFVQIGQGAQYQFCKKNLSPFEALFSGGFYEPKLLVLSYLGNSTKKWAKSPKAALKDVRETMHQLPAGLPCVFMTTIPTYTQKSVNLRVKAQGNLKKAFEATGNRCAFVEGLNVATIAENLGNKRHFKRRGNGKGYDPFHPKPRAARKFFALEKKNICAAVFKQLAEHTQTLN
jgi:hypothetical protein